MVVVDNTGDDVLPPALAAAADVVVVDAEAAAVASELGELSELGDGRTRANSDGIVGATPGLGPGVIPGTATPVRVGCVDRAFASDAVNGIRQVREVWSASR